MRAAISERRRCALDVRPSDPHWDPEGVLHWACFADGGTEERMGELANTPGGGGRLHFCPHLCLPGHRAQCEHPPQPPCLCRGPSNRRSDASPGAEDQMTSFRTNCQVPWPSPMAQQVKNLPAMQKTQEMRVQPLGQEDPLEAGMATCSSVLAWRIPWTEEPGGLQSMGLQSQTSLK